MGLEEGTIKEFLEELAEELGLPPNLLFTSPEKRKVTDGTLEFRVEPTKESFDYYERIVCRFSFRNVSNREIRINTKLLRPPFLSIYVETLKSYVDVPKEVFRVHINYGDTESIKPKDFILLYPSDTYVKISWVGNLTTTPNFLNIPPGIHEINANYFYPNLDHLVGREFGYTNIWSGCLEDSCRFELTSKGMKKGYKRYDIISGDMPWYSKLLFRLF